MRFNSPIAYDAHRRRVVLHGGYCACDTPGTQETWEYGRICPADCDGISEPPAANVLDFACFLNKYAVGTGMDPHYQRYLYINCDRSTSEPMLNVADFACFLNAFAAGCS
jgi:hypothetical protein